MATETTCPICNVTVVRLTGLREGEDDIWNCSQCGQRFTVDDLAELEDEDPEPPQTFWTFIDLDWNLIRDDSDQADNFPCLLFKTIEAAQAAAQLFWDRLLADDQGQYMAGDDRQLTWHKTFDEYEASPREGFVLRVYSMEVQP